MRVRFAAIAVAVVALDQLTKLWVVRTLDPGDTRPLIDGWLHLSHVRNTGAAFGLLRGLGGVLALAALAGAVAFVVVIIRRPAPLVGVAAALIAGGALGNLSDRVTRGSVVDFLDLRFWPSFNVADMAISIGAILFLIAGAVERPDADQRVAEDDPSPAPDTEDDAAAEDRRHRG